MKKLRVIFLFLVIAVSLVACAPDQTGIDVNQTATPVDESSPWWRDAVFYEIFVRSFYDSDGDGIGDLNGVTEKLDYLQDLGVNAIWLMPIHPSPSYHGYDVTNFYAVNPEYGSKEDLLRLLDEAHHREMYIIIDLILNHTSSQHPFFRDANSGPDSKYRDWYVWSDEYPGWGANYWHEGNGGYYYGFFWGGMPDLNYNNPEVTDQMNDVIRYWVNEIGVDGFRLDAIKHLIEEDGKTESTGATHDWLRGFYGVVRGESIDAYLVGEVFGAGGFVATTYTGDQLDHVFNFELASGFLNSVNGESNTGVNSAFFLTLKDMPDGNYATFLTNHDQNRVMSVLRGKAEKGKAAASLLLTSPGTPFIYYGEEIGMQGVKPDPDIRLPMQWTGETYAGFSSAEPWRKVHESYQTINVADQQDSPDSLLSHYRTLISIRKDHPALRTGKTAILDSGTTEIFAALRVDEEEAILVVINLTEDKVDSLSLEGDELLVPARSYSMDPLFGTDQTYSIQIDDAGVFQIDPEISVIPYQTLIFELN
jgi:glycosidase